MKSFEMGGPDTTVEDKRVTHLCVCLGITNKVRFRRNVPLSLHVVLCQQRKDSSQDAFKRILLKDTKRERPHTVKDNIIEGI